MKINKNEISAPCEYHKRCLFNYHFFTKTLIANITFFKINKFNESRREYFETN